MKTEKQVFALGFFDGVHLGHQALLQICCQLARQINARAAAITFDRHPQSLFTSAPPVLINTGEDRQRLLRRFGIEAIHSLPVRRETMSLLWQDFLEMLVSFGAAGFVCGHDFRFGRGGEGNPERLRAFCAQRNLLLVVVPEQTLDGIRVSSSHIRGLVELGHMESAKKFLGHPHLLTGQVVQGRKLGNKLGFPTANVLIPEGIVCPRHGVYACRAWVGDVCCVAVTNVGRRPTVEGHQVRAESWLLDFSGDLYGQEIALEFHYFLRPEKKFDSLEQLKAAVLADGAKTRSYFREN